MSKLFPRGAKLVALKLVRSAGGDLFLLASALSFASRYLFLIHPIGPLESLSRPESKLLCASPSMTGRSELSLFRGRWLELEIDRLLTSAFSFSPRTMRGEVSPEGVEAPLSAFLLLDNRHRFFFSFSACSMVVMDCSSRTWSRSDPSLKDECRDVGGDFFDFSVLSG